MDSGKQVMPELMRGVPKANMPLDPTVAEVKLCPYKVTGNGRGMAIPQSSQFMPRLLVPGRKVPVPVVYVYGGVHVAVAVAVGVAVGVALGVGHAVSV